MRIFADLSGILRGKRYPVGYLGKLYGGEIAMPASVYLLDTMGASHDPGGIGFTDGRPGRCGAGGAGLALAGALGGAAELSAHDHPGHRG